MRIPSAALLLGLAAADVVRARVVPAPVTVLQVRCWWAEDVDQLREGEGAVACARNERLGRDEDEDEDGSSQWTTVQIVTPIVVGLGVLLICFALFLWYRARHKPAKAYPQPPHSALERARHLPVFNSFNSLPQVREASPDPNWTIDVDAANDPYLHANGAGHARSSSATPLVGTFASATNLSRRTEEWSDSGSGPWSRVRLLYMRAKWAMPWAERPVKIKSTQPNKRWRIDGTPGPSRRTTAQASIAAHDRALAVNSDGDVDHGPAEEERLLPDLASPGAGQPPVLHNQDAQATSPRAAAFPAAPPVRQDSGGLRNAPAEFEGDRGLLPDDTSVVLISRFPGEDFTIASSSDDQHRGIVVVPPSRHGTTSTARQESSSEHWQTPLPSPRQEASSSRWRDAFSPPSPSSPAPEGQEAYPPPAPQLNDVIPPSPHYPPPTPPPAGILSSPPGARSPLSPPARILSPPPRLRTQFSNDSRHLRDRPFGPREQTPSPKTSPARDSPMQDGSRFIDSAGHFLYPSPQFQASRSGSSADLTTPASTAPSYDRYYDAHSPLTATISPAEASSENTHGVQNLSSRGHDNSPAPDALTLAGPRGPRSPSGNDISTTSLGVNPTSADLNSSAPDFDPYNTDLDRHERLPTYREASLSRRPLPTPSPHLLSPPGSPPSRHNPTASHDPPRYSNPQYLSPPGSPPRGLQHQQFRSLGDMREDSDWQPGRLPPRERWVSADDLLAQPEEQGVGEVKNVLESMDEGSCTKMRLEEASSLPGGFDHSTLVPRRGANEHSLNVLDAAMESTAQRMRRCDKLVRLGEGGQMAYPQHTGICAPVHTVQYSDSNRDEAGNVTATPGFPLLYSDGTAEFERRPTLAQPRHPTWTPMPTSRWLASAVNVLSGQHDATPGGQPNGSPMPLGPGSSMMNMAWSASHELRPSLRCWQVHQCLSTQSNASANGHLNDLGILPFSITTTRKRVNVSRASPMTCYKGSPMLSTKLSICPRQRPDATQERQCPRSSPNAVDTGSSMWLIPMPRRPGSPMLTFVFSSPRLPASIFVDGPIQHESVNDRASSPNSAKTGLLNDFSEIASRTVQHLRPQPPSGNVMSSTPAITTQNEGPAPSNDSSHAATQ
ncbi:hypothetical protein GGG16DRAFT_102201 [Schizophyllum commune]